jgi:uncharacterized protein
MKQIWLLSIAGGLLLCTAPLRAQQSDTPVEVTVGDLQPTPYGVSITLQAVHSDDQLHMLIGLAEGEAIARVIQHRPPQRPLTHDLIKMILDLTGWNVDRIVIRALRSDTYLADLVLEKDGQSKTIDARPSDAMAIAVRTNARILVNPNVFDAERDRRQQGPKEDQPKENTPEPGGVHL